MGRRPKKYPKLYQKLHKQYIRRSIGRKGYHMDDDLFEKVKNEHWVSGWSLQDLAKRLGIGAASLRRQFTVRGEKVRPRGRKPKQKSMIVQEYQRDLREHAKISAKMARQADLTDLKDYNDSEL